MPTRMDHAKTLLDNLLTAVILMDERLCIQFVNPAAEQLLSLSERRLIGIELPHLLVTIEEADGSKRSFTVPFSSVTQMLRPGSSRCT